MCNIVETRGRRTSLGSWQCLVIGGQRPGRDPKRKAAQVCSNAKKTVLMLPRSKCMCNTDRIARNNRTFVLGMTCQSIPESAGTFKQLRSCYHAVGIVPMLTLLALLCRLCVSPPAYAIRQALEALLAKIL